MSALNPAQHKYLYSVNPYFVYDISLQYFGGKFFAYAASDFDSHDVPGITPPKPMPDGSTPKKIYFEYEKSVKGKQTGKLATSVQKLRKVVQEKFSDNESLLNELQELLFAVEQSPELHYPLIYVIDFASVVAKAEEKTISGLGEPTLEYIIRDMQRQDFVVINVDPDPVTRINNP